jgi:hypothetical protein
MRHAFTYVARFRRAYVSLCLDDGSLREPSLGMTHANFSSA